MSKFKITDLPYDTRQITMSYEQYQRELSELKKQLEELEAIKSQNKLMIKALLELSEWQDGCGYYEGEETVKKALKDAGYTDINNSPNREKK